MLARFDDGAPAVLEKAVGRGRVVVWTSTLDLFWNDLALKPVYLPFVHQLTRHLADYRERANWATVGQVIDLSQEGDASRARVAVTPAGARVPLEGDQGRVLELSEQGFYEVREQGRQAALLVAVAASNVELARIGPNGRGSRGNRRRGDRRTAAATGAARRGRRPCRTRRRSGRNGSGGTCCSRVFCFLQGNHCWRTGCRARA